MTHETRNTFASLIDWLCRQAIKAAFFTFFSSAGITAATAQIQFPVGLPTPKVGDIAKYRTVDLWNNKKLPTSESELVEISANNFISRFKSSVTPEPRTIRSDLSWNACAACRTVTY